MPEKLFEALRKDHNEVKGIFQKLLHAKKGDQREQFLEQLRSEIIPHMKAEEKTLYTTLRRECKECSEDVLESFEEHHAARIFLNELQELPLDDEKFMAKATVLKEIVEHHLQEEESTLFDDIKKNMKKETAEQVLKQFQEEKKRMMKQLH